MKESDKLLELVCLTPEDWQLRLILADAYEEEGSLSYSQCQRWMSINKKRAQPWLEDPLPPGHAHENEWAVRTSGGTKLVEKTIGRYEWYDKRHIDNMSEVGTALLPRMPRTARSWTEGVRVYGTRKQSELAIMLAYTKLHS